jgi:hypothetical protein
VPVDPKAWMPTFVGMTAAGRRRGRGRMVDVITDRY